MPELARIPQADGLAILDDIGDDQDFRMVSQQELFEYMDLQHAEATAKGNLLLGSDTLVTKDHDMMIEVRAMNPRKVMVIDRSGQIQAYDLGPHAAGKRATSSSTSSKELPDDATTSAPSDVA